MVRSKVFFKLKTLDFKQPNMLLALPSLAMATIKTTDWLCLDIWHYHQPSSSHLWLGKICCHGQWYEVGMVSYGIVKTDPHKQLLHSLD